MFYGCKDTKKDGQSFTPTTLINVKRMAFSFNRPKCVLQFGKIVTSQKEATHEAKQLRESLKC